MVLFPLFPRRGQCAECNKDLPPRKAFEDVVRFCTGTCATTFYRRAGLSQYLLTTRGGTKA